ncbi:MAG TPA: DinB family protein [Micromonospora sp.]
MSVTPDQWHRVRDSVPAVLRRLLALVDRAPPDLAVTAEWSVADTLAHLATVTAMDVGLVRGTDPDLPVPEFDDLVRTTTVDSLSVMNVELMGHFTERDVPALAARLRADVDTLLAVTEVTGPLAAVTWFGDARLTVAGLLAHLLNELNLHGWDIARAVGVPWRIDPRDGALVVDLFLVGMIRCGYGSLLDHDRPARPGRISVTFRSDFSPPVTLALVDGRVVVAPLDSRPDVRLSFDPAAFTLMLFGRMSRLRAALARKVSVGGRRPWLLPAFLSVMRPPS